MFGLRIGVREVDSPTDHSGHRPPRSLGLAGHAIHPLGVEQHPEASLKSGHVLIMHMHTHALREMRSRWREIEDS